MKSEINTKELVRLQKRLYTSVLVSSSKQTIKVSFSDAQIIYEAIGQLILILELREG